MQRTIVYDPVPSEWKLDPKAAAKSVEVVQFPGGKVIGIVDNGKLKKFAEALDWHLRARGARDVVHWKKHYQEGSPDDALIADVVGKVDATIVGLGN
jgi:hypothetical protein